MSSIHCYNSNAPSEPEDAGPEILLAFTNVSLQGFQRLRLIHPWQGRSAWELPEEGSIPTSEGLVHQVSTADVDSRESQQRYNRRGYPINPASRGVARTSRRAQNEVLSTVGFCVGIREDGSSVDASLILAKASKNEKERVESVRKENEAGLLLGAASHGLMFLSIWWILGLRIRLQVCSLVSLPTLTLRSANMKRLRHSPSTQATP